MRMFAELMSSRAGPGDGGEMRDCDILADGLVSENADISCNSYVCTEDVRLFVLFASDKSGSFQSGCWKMELGVDPTEQACR